MTALQKLNIRASDIRLKLSELASAEGELSDEQRSELATLKKEYQDIETRSQALTIAGDAEPEPEPVDDAEGRELRSLIDGASISMICNAALSNGIPDGETRELQEHFNLDANEVPFELLETRAVTTAPSNTGRTQAEIIMPVFARGAAGFLNIPTPTVPKGDRVYPILTNRPTVAGPYTDSTAVDETTGSFTADALAPEVTGASFFYRRTDAARFAGMDAALREALSSALLEAHDYQILRGAAGLFTGTNISKTAATGIDSFQTYVSRLGFGRVDGRFANMLSDIKVLVGSATFAHMGSQYNNPVYDNAANVLSNKLGGLRVTAHAPAVASGKQNTIVRLGNRRDAVSPVWQGVQLIPDQISKAATHEIKISAYMLYAVKILRAGGFAKIETQHA